MSPFVHGPEAAFQPAASGAGDDKGGRARPKRLQDRLAAADNDHMVKFVVGCGCQRAQERPEARLLLQSKSLVVRRNPERVCWHGVAQLLDLTATDVEIRATSCDEIKERRRALLNLRPDLPRPWLTQSFPKLSEPDRSVFFDDVLMQADRGQIRAPIAVSDDEVDRRGAQRSHIPRWYGGNRS